MDFSTGFSNINAVGRQYAIEADHGRRCFLLVVGVGMGVHRGFMRLCDSLYRNYLCNNIPRLNSYPFLVAIKYRFFTFPPLS